MSNLNKSFIPYELLSVKSSRFVVDFLIKQVESRKLSFAINSLTRFYSCLEICGDRYLRDLRQQNLIHYSYHNGLYHIFDNISYLKNLYAQLSCPEPGFWKENKKRIFVRQLIKFNNQLMLEF